MCHEWNGKSSDGELSLSQISAIFENPLFSAAERFVLTGGEPVLRDDLAEIARIFVESQPKVRELLLLTNGLKPSLVVECVKNLLALTGRNRGMKLAVSLSLDGYGEVHERIRGVPQAFSRVTETIKRLKELQKQKPFYLSAVCVIQPANTGILTRLAAFGEEQALPLTFVPVQVGDHYVEDDDSRSSLTFTVEQIRELKYIIGDQLLPRMRPANIAFWREYFNIKAGKRRNIPCFLCRHYIRLESNGSLSSCFADSSLVYGSALDTPADRLWFSGEAKKMRDRIEKSICPTCTIYCDLDYAFSHEFFYYAKFLLKEKSRELLRQ